MAPIAEAFDVPTASGSLSFHRVGHHDPVIAGPAGAFYSASAVLNNPITASWVRGIVSFATGLLMDRRGLGWSDPLSEDRVPTLENQADDIEAVLDYAGVRKAYLWAIGFDAQPVLWFAATRPERTAGVIALGTTPKLLRSEDHPTGMDPLLFEQWIAALAPGAKQGAQLDMFGLVAPSAADESATRAWFDRAGRNGASPQTARRYLEAAATFDVREAVGRILAPMLVMHNRGDRLIDVADARLLAKLSPNARLVERDRSDHVMFTGDSSDVLAEIERLVTGSSGRRRRTRARSGWDALTPAELRVAALVAAGRSNAEIAAELVVSAETVKSHLKAAFLKTGATSRTALARQHLSADGQTD